MPIHPCSYACIRHQHSLIENLETVIANVPKSLYFVCFLNLLNILQVVFFSFQLFSIYITRKEAKVSLGFVWVFISDRDLL
jgi:hypothetical protein